MMSLVRLVAMALALAGTSSSFHPSESVRNQYQDTTLFKALLPKNQKASDIYEENQTQNRRTSRRRRSYVPWSRQVIYPSPYSSLTVWKAPTYPLERPYFVPIYGIAGKHPIYFPPQPLRLNPGVPRDNPGKYRGPQYLPPVETTTMSIKNRFDDDNDRPIWDIGSNELTTISPAEESFEIIPTRGPPPPDGGVPPPLIHNPSNGGGSSSSSNNVEYLPPPQVYPTRRPPTTRRPQITRLPTRPPTTIRPEPTRCVWAIISCCSGSGEISYDCFEERGCVGAFWDNSPCDSDFAKAAIASALNYYN